MAIAAGVHQTWWREFFKKLYPFTPPDLSTLGISITLKTLSAVGSKPAQPYARNEITLAPDNPNCSFALLLSQRLSFHLEDPGKQCPPLT